MVIFNSYVSLPEGISTNMLVVCVLTSGIPECEWENDDKPGDVYNSPRSYRQLEVLSIAVKTKKMMLDVMFLATLMVPRNIPSGWWFGTWLL